MRSTPPLAWLRAFEAAARLLSFKDAAAELNVSPSTISHQVRDLEAALETLLFSRKGNRLQLTDEASRVLVPLSQGFELIRQSTMSDKPRHQLSIGAFPFLGSEVLLPAVAELKSILKTEHLTFQTRTDLSSLMQARLSDRVDVVIKYGPKPDKTTPAFPGYLSVPLFPIRLVPICAVGQMVPTNLDELLALPRVRLSGAFNAWESWSKALDIEVPEKAPVLETDNYHAAVLAVERGDGCCLGVFPFLSTWLTNNRICALEQFGCEIPDYAYLVYAHHNRDLEAIPKLANWLTSTLK